MMFSRELWTLNLPLYLMKPSLRKRSPEHACPVTGTPNSRTANVRGFPGLKHSVAFPDWNPCLPDSWLRRVCQGCQKPGFKLLQQPLHVRWIQIVRTESQT